MNLTNEERQALINLANEARRRAYAPYSNYPVGAALRTKGGRLYTGVNVENAAYPQTMCAERVAIFKAVSEGETEFEVIAVVTNNGGNVQVTNNPGVNIALLSSIPATCSGLCNGSLSVSGIGGTSPYSYVWSNASTTLGTGSVITGLCAGSYTVTITDNASCTSVSTYSVSQPALLVSPISWVNATCFGSAGGSASVIAGGGVSPYTYVWSNLQTQMTLTGLPAGTYTVTVTGDDGHGGDYDHDSSS